MKSNYVKFHKNLYVSVINIFLLYKIKIYYIITNIKICSNYNKITAHWRWQLKYIHPRKANMAPLYQVAFLGSVFGYCINYLRLSKFICNLIIDY